MKILLVRDFKSFEKIALMFLPVRLTFIGWMPGSRDVVQSIIARKPFILDKKSNKTVGKCMDLITKKTMKNYSLKKHQAFIFSALKVECKNVKPLRYQNISGSN